MEHRKFQQRLDELVAELTYAQAQKVRRRSKSAVMAMKTCSVS